MKRTADAVIVGGGCMGTSTAWHLAERGITDVVLLEREPQLGAGSTGRNAGGVRHQFSHEANIRLSLESIAFLERFEVAVGRPIDYWRDGYLFLLSSEESIAAFREAVGLQQALGVPTQWLTPGEAAGLVPGLDVTGVRAATFCDRDGICDPNGVTLGFAAAAARSGVEILRSAGVVTIQRDRRGVAAVTTGEGAIATRIVVDAAGAWAGQVGQMAGLNVPIRPVRRHIFIAQPPEPEGWHTRIGDGRLAPTAPSSRIMVIDFDTSFYFHREGAGLLFGMGDPNEPPGFDTTVRWDFLEEVSQVAVTRLPALGEAAVSHAWAGLYEMTPDHMPIIGPVTELDGFYLIAGFSGHGFQHSPAAGRILADLINGADPGFDLSAFTWDRFETRGSGGERHFV